MRIFILSLITAVAMLGSGCAPRLGGEDYEASSVGEVSTTTKGTIVAAKKIRIHAANADRPGAGALAGTAAGAATGSSIGGGNSMPLISAVVGGIAGGLAGHAIEQKVTAQDGMEYQIKLENKSDLITITQGLTPKLDIGQKVLVIKSTRGRSRVIADHT